MIDVREVQEDLDANGAPIELKEPVDGTAPVLNSHLCDVIRVQLGAGHVYCE